MKAEEEEEEEEEGRQLDGGMATMSLDDDDDDAAAAEEQELEPPPPRWSVGQALSGVLSTSGHEREVVVMEVSGGGEKLKLHYEGFQAKYDEWMATSDPRFNQPAVEEELSRELSGFENLERHDSLPEAGLSEVLQLLDELLNMVVDKMVSRGDRLCLCGQPSTATCRAHSAPPADLLTSPQDAVLFSSDDSSELRQDVLDFYVKAYHKKFVDVASRRFSSTKTLMLTKGETMQLMQFVFHYTQSVSQYNVLVSPPLVQCVQAQINVFAMDARAQFGDWLAELRPRTDGAAGTRKAALVEVDYSDEGLCITSLPTDLFKMMWQQIHVARESTSEALLMQMAKSMSQAVEEWSCDFAHELQLEQARNEDVEDNAEPLDFEYLCALVNDMDKVR